MNSILHPDLIVWHMKKGNKTRKIISYRSNDCSLRLQHNKIREFIDKNFIPSIFAKGYVRNRSIYDNALAHMYNDYFIMLDIKNFFPHICHNQLADKIFFELNLLKANQINQQECFRLVQLCSVSKRGLPLGFVTSPILSNLYLKEFDGIFYGKLKHLELENIIYTRYADDLIISFKTNTSMKLPTIDQNVKEIASLTLKRYGLRLNPKKFRSYNLNVSNHVRITGISITKTNENKRRLSVGKSIKNKLYWDAIDCCENQQEKSTIDIQKIKGIQSFILSIEKTGFESCYSEAMLNKINNLGFTSLKDLIDQL